MHRIYALKYTEASKSFNQFSNMKKNPGIRSEEPGFIPNNLNIQQTEEN